MSDLLCLEDSKIRNEQGKETNRTLSLFQEIVVKHKGPYGLGVRHELENTHGFRCPALGELKVRDWA